MPAKAPTKKITGLSGNAEASTDATNGREALVAIVGEPNVGKSTLLNRLVSERAALTSDIAGTTRDRFYAPTSWNGVDFSLVDTAGIMLEQRDELERNIQKQVEIALAEADVILYVIDGKQPRESINRTILQKLRKQKKPVILAINKIDSPKKLNLAEGEFQFTGIKKIFPVSAISGFATGDLLDAVTNELKELGFTSFVKDPTELYASIVGKPNVGKSSLFNYIIGEERVVVSSMAGTTRNAIDTRVEYKEKKITFVDTAGLKKREKRAPLPDIYAAFQTIRAIHKSDICIFVIDGVAGITQQDQRIAADIVEAGKGMIVAVNKTDLLSQKELAHLHKEMENLFPFLWWAPIVPISAKTGAAVEELLDYILKIEESRKKEIDAEALTKFFRSKLKQRQPQRIRDERVPKVFSLTQVHKDPPVFRMLVNEPSAISMQFRKFIENSIIKELGFWGTPVALKLQARKGNPNLPAAFQD